jgi:hypothetical protein
MRWTVDVRTVREHDQTGDLPPRFEATIRVEKPDAANPVTLTDVRNLLTAAVSQLSIPGTSLLTDELRLSIQWT